MKRSLDDVLRERAMRCSTTSVSELDWQIAPSAISLRRMVRPSAEIAVMGNGNATDFQLGEKRLHVAESSVTCCGVADMAYSAVTGQLSQCSRVGIMVPNKAHTRTEQNWLPSYETIPAASWPRCCNACSPKAVSVAASGWPKMPNTPHSSCSVSSSRDINWL